VYALLIHLLQHAKSIEKSGNFNKTKTFFFKKSSEKLLFLKSSTHNLIAMATGGCSK
jgi:hypothetical protein